MSGPTAHDPWPPPPGPGLDAWSSPPAPGNWDPAPWEPAPPPRPRRRLVSAAVALGLLLVSGVGGAVIGAKITGSSQPAPSTAVLPPPGAAPGSAGAPPSGGSSDVSSIAAQVDPAVVDITSTFPDGAAAGTGMVITASGQVLTNNHVIDGASSIEVRVAGTGPSYSAHVIGADVANDVALVQIEGASGLKTVSIGDSSRLSVGQTVTAIGNALGRQGPPSAAQGQVTALNRTITATDQNGGNAETLSGLIQVNANVLPGDSGGPLVDSSAKVIGMDTAASTRRFRFRTGASTGFAIPINSAMSIATGLRSGAGSSAPAAQRALLGVEVQDATAQGTSGAYVASVQSGSPAASAGLAAGDLIVSLGGQSVDSASALTAAIRAHHPGDRVSVGWINQAGQQRTATVTLASAAA
jgi:S1-C subfamily serine protease